MSTYRQVYRKPTPKKVEPMVALCEGCDKPLFPYSQCNCIDWSSLIAKSIGCLAVGAILAGFSPYLPVVVIYFVFFHKYFA